MECVSITPPATPAIVDEFKPEHIEYARHRVHLEEPVAVAAYHADLDKAEAAELETDPKYDKLVQFVEHSLDAETLATLARQRIADALKDNLDDIPAHSLLELSKWVADRADPEFKAERRKQTTDADEDDDQEDALDDLDDDELRQILDTEQESDKPITLPS